MKHRAGLDRSQTLLFPERLEDYIAAENPVRFLDAFVGSLDNFRRWRGSSIDPQARKSPLKTSASQRRKLGLLFIQQPALKFVARAPYSIWRVEGSTTDQVLPNWFPKASNPFPHCILCRASRRLRAF